MLHDDQELVLEIRNLRMRNAELVAGSENVEQIEAHRLQMQQLKAHIQMQDELIQELRKNNGELSSAHEEEKKRLMNVFEKELHSKSLEFEQQLSLLKSQLRQQQMSLVMEESARSKLAGSEITWNTRLELKEKEILRLKADVCKLQLDLQKAKDAEANILNQKVADSNRLLIQQLQKTAVEQISYGQYRDAAMRRESELLDQIAFWKGRATGAEELLSAKEVLLLDAKEQLAQLRREIENNNNNNL